VAAVARELGRSWDTINTITIQATTELLATLGPVRLDGGRVIGVDEHRWAHTRHAAGAGYVTVIVDLTAVVENSGPARLLDLVADRSAAALTTWLAARTPAFREQIEIVAMDGFGGYKSTCTGQGVGCSGRWRSGRGRARRWRSRPATRCPARPATLPARRPSGPRPGRSLPGAPPRLWRERGR
jgi:hypothetical protein